MHHLVKTDVVPLTPELAKNFATLPTFKGDRQRDSLAGRQRIAWLNRLVDEEKFYTPKWATAELNGVLYRVNGGHSSMMLAERNGEFPLGLQAVIDRFHCETRDDLADLFDQFDQRRSIRSCSEKIKAHLGVHDDLDGVSGTDAGRSISGIAYYLTFDGDQSRLDEEERIRLIHAHKDFLKWAAQFSGRRLMSSVGIQAAMYVTWLRSHELADKFWSLVRDESHPDKDNATRTLATFLRDSVSRKKPNTAAPAWNTRAYFVKSIHAWNAWRTNARTSLKYRSDTSWPRVM